MSPKTRKNQLLLLFHTKAVKTCVFYLKAVSNVMHCYDDKDDFALALRVALAEVQRGSWECGRGGSQLFSIGPIWWGGLIIMILRASTWFLYVHVWVLSEHCSRLFFSYIHDLLSATVFWWNAVHITVLEAQSRVLVFHCYSFSGLHKSVNVLQYWADT